MANIDSLFARLQRSTFRSRFHLGRKERQYCVDKGPEIIDQHAADFMSRVVHRFYIHFIGRGRPGPASLYSSFL